MLSPDQFTSLNRYENRWIKAIPGIFLVSTSLGFVQLMYMQLKEMPVIGAAILTFLYAFAALMYSRAQSATINQKKAAFAADQCFKACLLATLAYVITYWIFLILSAYYPPVPFDFLEPANLKNTPALLPFLAVIVLMYILVFPIFIRLAFAVNFTAENMTAHENSILGIEE